MVVLGLPGWLAAVVQLAEVGQLESAATVLCIACCVGAAAAERC